MGISLPASAVDAIIRRIAQIAHQQRIYFLWRPFLPDPKDDMVLEAAIASGATHIVTFNLKDLLLASQFAITVLTPAHFIRLLP